MRAPLLSVVILLGALAGAKGAESDQFADPNSSLPEYSFPYNDGLYATIAGFLGVKSVSIDNQHSYELEIRSFKHKVPVEAVIQDHPAPLVVVLLGISGRTYSDFSKLWASYYAQAGYHVLEFDSTFCPGFVKMSGHGVTGNLWAESERVGEIINSFTQMKKIRGKITQIGVVGMSYGGTQALVLGRMANEGKLPFAIASIQAYSPPIRFDHSAAIIDRWYNEERFKYTLVEMQGEFKCHKNKDDGSPPYSESLMRAALATSFRITLPDVIVQNDEHYKLHLLPHGDNFNDPYVQQEAAEKWGYSRFAYDMSLTYWQKKIGENAIDSMIKESSLMSLLQHQPAYSETILAQDDPLNTPEDMSLLRSNAGPARLTVLPRGGHLGYVATKWTRAKLMTLFGAPAAPERSTGVTLSR